MSYMGSRIARNSMVVVASMAISVFAWGQHKEESKGSGGGHASGPSGQSHASRPSGGGGGQSRPSGGRGQASRPNQDRAPGARPGGMGGNRQGNPNRQGNASGPRNNPSGNRPENGNGNRAGNPGGNRGNAGGANRGNMGGNRAGNAGNRGNMGGNRANAASSPKFTAPGRNVSLRGGGSASIRPNGQIRSINRNGMQIHQNIHGGRTIVTERNGTRIVNTGRGGYVQRSYMVHGGATYYSRTYYSGGVYRVGLYRGYYYGGYRYYGYYPGFWYHPGFYGWAYRPWGPPLYWGVGIGGWGWAGSPWWGFYGGWWAPYPYYASPAFWLTDYLIAQSLQDSYASQYATADSAGGYDQGASNQGPSGPSNYNDQGQASNSEPVQLTPEVKEAIAEEVKAQLAEQQQQAPTGDSQGQSAAPAPTNDVPPALDPARRTFVVHNEITVVSDGQECELTGGDVLTRLTDTPDANQMVTASVAASKKSECAAGSQVAVSVDALQEMHNHFEEQLNNGLKALAEKQGTGGMPKAPDTGTVASPVPTPQPDENASKELADQQTQADQTESQVKQEAAGSGGGNQ